MTQHARSPRISDTLVSHMNLQPLREGEEDVRFDKVDHFLTTEGAHRFFMGSRLTFNHTMQVGVFRQGIRRIPVNPDEAAIYQPWIIQSNSEIYQQGKRKYSPSEARVEELRQQQDPAIHIYDKLEEIRLDRFPSLPKEPELLTNALGAYAVILASIHGRNK